MGRPGYIRSLACSYGFASAASTISWGVLFGKRSNTSRSFTSNAEALDRLKVRVGWGWTFAADRHRCSWVREISVACAIRLRIQRGRDSRGGSCNFCNWASQSASGCRYKDSHSAVDRTTPPALVSGTGPAKWPLQPLPPPRPPRRWLTTALPPAPTACAPAALGDRARYGTEPTAPIPPWPLP